MYLLNMALNSHFLAFHLIQHFYSEVFFFGIFPYIASPKWGDYV